MGIEAVIFLLAAANVVISILWRADVKDRNIEISVLKVKSSFLTDALADEQKRSDGYQTEIRRLRAIPLTSKPDKPDTSVIKAKSPADVRRLTEAAFGKPGMEN